MIPRKRGPSDIAVPGNLYRHLQAGFAESSARTCGELERNRIFNPGDAFIDMLMWLWGGIDSPLASGESLASALLAGHFTAVNPDLSYGLEAGAGRRAGRVLSVDFSAGL
jgi:hypothetical protein